MSRKKHVKCVVKDCQNHRDEGEFVGGLCYPCFRFIVEGVDVCCTSQAYRNALSFVWPRIKRHVGLRVAELLCGFEGRPTDLSGDPEHRYQQKTISDSELAALLRPEPMPSASRSIAAKKPATRRAVRGAVRR